MSRPEASKAYSMQVQRLWCQCAQVSSTTAARGASSGLIRAIRIMAELLPGPLHPCWYGRTMLLDHTVFFFLITSFLIISSQSGTEKAYRSNIGWSTHNRQAPALSSAAVVDPAHGGAWIV
ncbi:hypothetical protein ASPBRDRAFT_43739 [Aspergillus brasiliensis CBS 101740]|uniref:Uncharacterized protein n=1 Tax=Aspergillus brasiliensis (strain CBS 101740 / IMI 381727 / IBT 21946) TaxID=767769 RepID=A0A1L9UGQ7_ASPBC|nr:hypothetical protein ASPBRDRAFT_43739 [Aspergillus brasiliensis CBS 101740]